MVRALRNCDILRLGDGTYCPQYTLRGSRYRHVSLTVLTGIVKEASQLGTHLDLSRAVLFRTPQSARRLAGLVLAHAQCVHDTCYTFSMRLDGDKLLRALFVLIWVLVCIHIAAEYYYWYWTYRWFDVPMHILGGMWLGITGIWLVHYSGYLRGRLRNLSYVVTALLTGIVAGSAWELYEYGVLHLSKSGIPVNYLMDTLLDLAMDTAGAFVGYVFFRQIVTYPPPTNRA